MRSHALSRIDHLSDLTTWSFVGDRIRFDCTASQARRPYDTLLFLFLFFRCCFSLFNFEGLLFLLSIFGGLLLLFVCFVFSLVCWFLLMLFLFFLGGLCFLFFVVCCCCAVFWLCFVCLLLFFMFFFGFFFFFFFFWGGGVRQKETGRPGREWHYLWAPGEKLRALSLNSLAPPPRRRD